MWDTVHSTVTDGYQGLYLFTNSKLLFCMGQGSLYHLCIKDLLLVHMRQIPCKYLHINCLFFYSLL